MNWQLVRSLTPAELADVLKALGLSHAALARYTGMSERQVYRMVHGLAPVPVTIALLLSSLLHHGEKPTVPPRTLDARPKPVSFP